MPAEHVCVMQESQMEEEDESDSEEDDSGHDETMNGLLSCQ